MLDCLQECGLEDMRCRGRHFTWTNNTITSKIDRILINDKWIEEHAVVVADFATESLFYHIKSIIVHMHLTPRRRKNRFRYCNMWGKDATFSSLVQSVWQRTVRGCPKTHIVCKLKMLQRVSSPVRRKYSEVFHRVDDLRQQLEDIQDRKTLIPQDRHAILAEQHLKEEYLKEEYVKWSRAHNFMP